MNDQGAATAGAGTAGHVAVSPLLFLRRRPGSRRTVSSHNQARFARVAAVGLWALVGFAVLGGMAGILSAARGGSADPREPVAEAGATSPAAEGFAELYVMTWLRAGEGQESELLAFSPDSVSLQGTKPDSFRARWAGTVGSRQVEPGYWSVTVAAEVEQAGAAGYEPAGLRYYQVPVVARNGGLVVTALPAQVPAPVRSELPPLELTASGLLPPGEVAETIEKFFAAYLTDQADVERYVRPGADVRGVVPAPFVETKVVAGKLRETDDDATAAVQVTGKDAGGRTRTTAYTVHLQRRDGRWEVAEILAAPPLAPVTPLEQKGKTK